MFWHKRDPPRLTVLLSSFSLSLSLSLSAQPRLCHPRTSCYFGRNTAGRSQHQFHQQPVLRLHNHQAGWKVNRPDKHPKQAAHANVTNLPAARWTDRLYLFCCLIMFFFKLGTILIAAGKNTVAAANCAAIDLLLCSHSLQFLDFSAQFPEKSNKAPLVHS